MRLEPWKFWNNNITNTIDTSITVPSIADQICNSLKREEENCIMNEIKCRKLTAERVIFSPPATIVIWTDGTKTVVKCDERDTYDRLTGLALCYMKKALGNRSGPLNKVIREAGL